MSSDGKQIFFISPELGGEGALRCCPSEFASSIPNGVFRLAEAAWVNSDRALRFLGMVGPLRIWGSRADTPIGKLYHFHGGANQARQGSYFRFQNVHLQHPSRIKRYLTLAR